MSLIDAILGRPLASREARGERLSTVAGIPTFGLDALSSAAYGPEAALTVLLPLGATGLRYILPVSTAIVLLLSFVYLSYRQTIAAYRGGGGSYTVARKNLGTKPGLLAAAALMTDYVLNVAVGISAGVGAMISALPQLQPHTLALCLAILSLLTVVNLRGIREAGALFMLPTCMFVLSLFAVIILGVIATLLSGGHPHPSLAPTQLAHAAEPVGWWLLLRAFASGCTALTGVEAVSNGVQAFREPRVPAARRTLTAIVLTLMVLLLGIAYLSRSYGVGATEPGTPQYQSVLSQLIAAVVGRGTFYWISLSSILLVLCLSANTSFADFPRLCCAVAEDGFFPRSFANRGRRLVYTEGIGLLALLSAILLIAFGGVTDRLIPLFAVGAFLAFTLSQGGMVAHWWKSHNRGVFLSIAINGLGATATAVTLAVVTLVKFMAGAWMVVLLVPSLMILMLATRRHYRRVAGETAALDKIRFDGLTEPMVIVPIAEWNSIAENALRFALTISHDVEALHIESEDSQESLRHIWPSVVEEPARMASHGIPRLTILKSPYRWVIQPIIDHVAQVARNNSGRTTAVLVPQLIESRWYNYFLHNQRGTLLSARLMALETDRIVVIRVPWYLKK